MSRRNSEMVTYLYVAILLTAFGGILAIIGTWVYLNNPELEFQGYAIYAIGAPILICMGIPLLISGLARRSDENRREAQEIKSERRKKRNKARK